MGYAGIPKKSGKDFNFFEKQDINWTTFGGGASDGYGPDFAIPFSTHSVIFINEGTGVLEYSFTGYAVAGELDSSTVTKGLIFDFRTVGLIWFRVKTGSTGPIRVQVQAWANS